ncbi:helix-turn-helix domain-containing protein [Microbulbifer sp. PSTR4-B]|uniref:helix-turn-helix domain-containing protein n=1 Tax=unclassified Microbulbifer TaxID=2619833 RepID=UPI00403AD095
MKRQSLRAQLPADWGELSPGGRLLARRRAEGLRQHDIATASGLSIDRVRALEHDQGRLSPPEILPVLRSYNLSPEQWLQGQPGAQGDIPAETWRRLQLLSPGEMRAVERLVFNLTEGRE